MAIIGLTSANRIPTTTIRPARPGSVAWVQMPLWLPAVAEKPGPLLEADRLFEPLEEPQQAQDNIHASFDVEYSLDNLDRLTWEANHRSRR